MCWFFKLQGSWCYHNITEREGMPGYLHRGLPNRLLVLLYRGLKKAFGPKRIYWHDYILWWKLHAPTITKYILPFRCIEDRIICSLSGNLAVDIGAAKGYYTIRFAEKFRRVVAFEPNTTNHRALLRNLAHQKLTNVEVYKVAISDGIGREKFYIWNSYCHSLVESLKRDKRKEVVTVLTIPLHRVFPTEVIDIIKVDVEGGELLVLKGAEPIVENIKAWMIEIHGGTPKSFRERKDRAQKWLQRHNYETRWLDINHVYAWRLPEP